MAHIKLANPRRSLVSQVLLSNFMYSYLAIVQAMHPQMNVPTSPQQKRLEEEARRKQQEQEYLAQQQSQGDEDAEHSLDQYNFDYHRVSTPEAPLTQTANTASKAAVQYADSGPDGQVEYVDDAQIYEDEHREDDNSNNSSNNTNNNNNNDDEGYDYDNMEGYGQDVKEYFQYRDNGDDHRRHDRNDMW